MRDSEASHYHYDGIGAVTELTDASAKTAQTYTYDAFGNLLSEQGQVENPYRFSTKEYSPASGLIYFGARYYEPASGRFIQKDPFTGFLHAPESLHKYVYANNNPVYYTDRDGLSSTEIGSPGGYTGTNGGRGGDLQLTRVDLGDLWDFGDLGGTKTGGKKGPKTETLNPPDDSEPLKKDEGEGKEEGGKEHKKKRPSTKEKHEKGIERKLRDQGGEGKDLKNKWPPKKFSGKGNKQRGIY